MSRRIAHIAWLVAAAVAVSCGGPSPSGSDGAPPATASASQSGTPASPSAAATVSATPTGPGAEAWTRVDLPEEATWLADVIALPGILVIAGSGGPTGQLALVWTSADGTAWATERPGGQPRLVSSAVAWGDRLLMVGGYQTDRCPHPAAIDTWVREADGGWSEAPRDDALCAGFQANPAVAADHALLVGAGTADVPFVLRSPDGLHWSSIPIGSAAGAPRTAANIGGTDLLFGASDAGAWVSRSADGATWSSLEPLANGAAADVIAAARLGSGLAVLVQDRAGAVGVLETGDGTTWTSAPTTGLEDQVIGGVVAVEGGLVAIGGDEERPAAWASTDGRAWQPVVLPTDVIAGTTLTGAAVFGGRAWLVGQVQGADRATGAAWSAPVPAFGR